MLPVTSHSHQKPVTSRATADDCDVPSTAELLTIDLPGRPRAAGGAPARCIVAAAGALRSEAHRRPGGVRAPESEDATTAADRPARWSLLRFSETVLPCSGSVHEGSWASSGTCRGRSAG